MMTIHVLCHSHREQPYYKIILFRGNVVRRRHMVVDFSAGGYFGDPPNQSLAVSEEVSGSLSSMGAQTTVDR